MQTPELYVLVIAALLPLSAGFVLLQVNPYRALMMRGMLGAIATLLYTVLGAADVALTEALVGTLLALLLYVVTVRSAMVLRIGIIATEREKILETDLLSTLKTALAKHYLRLELVLYPETAALEEALAQKAVHGVCLSLESNYQIQVRVARVYNLLKTEAWATDSIWVPCQTREVAP